MKYTIAELAQANNISEESAVRIFFERLEMGLEIGFGHKGTLSLNPFLMPFFGAVAGGSSDQKQN